MNVLAFDQHIGRRIEQLRLDAVADIARENDRHMTVSRFIVYAGLLAFCTLFWAGLIFLAEKVKP